VDDVDGAAVRGIAIWLTTGATGWGFGDAPEITGTTRNAAGTASTTETAASSLRKIDPQRETRVGCDLDRRRP
jgi:hypothetical protein